MTEELAFMKNLCRTIPEENIFEAEKTLIQYDLKWNLLRYVTTISKNMCQAEKGLVGLIYKAHETVRCLNSMVIHCAIQQPVIRRAYLNLLCVIKLIVVLMGNFICCYGFNHRQLCELLSEVEVEYLDLLYHIVV